MAEGEAAIFSSFSKSAGHSILSGSVRYSTDLILKTVKQYQMLQRRLEVKYYRIISNQRDAPRSIVSLKARLK